MNDTAALIAALENVPAVIISLIREMPPDYLKRRPSPAKWSAYEHACHLSGSDKPFRARLDLMLSSPDPVIQSIVNSPEVEAGALLNVDLDAALDRYVSERASLVKRLRELTPEEWQRTGRHDAFRCYSVWIMFRHHLTHEMSHAYRIEELLLQAHWE